MPEKLTKIELYIIAEVRKMREARGMSQLDLSLKLGKAVGFIGDIEAPSKSAKYNIKHLNEIAKIFDCSPKDFWPEKSL
ncbi:helix-turn-helix domain-containing protein [Flavobacterium anhuiense]|uniref:helix-turn-helix domain-containing protein n=1 Tax=Flavobacterium anhuiense TaxID=459526 RepID=UPI000E6BFF69|nr:helix-turn-helix transcriptional regulator [Flavobacterium anhuiense]